MTINIINKENVLQKATIFKLIIYSTWWNIKNIKNIVNPKSPSYWYKADKWEVKWQMWLWHNNW